MPERFYLAHDEWVLFDPDELAPRGEVITTGASLIESIQNFAEDFDVSLDDVQVYSDIGINNEWGGETYLHGDVRLRADCQRDHQADAPEWYAKKLAWYEDRMVKYRAKMVEYETAKPIHEAKMAEYRAWKAARENQKELRLLRRLQKKYAAEIAMEEIARASNEIGKDTVTISAAAYEDVRDRLVEEVARVSNEIVKNTTTPASFIALCPKAAAIIDKDMMVPAEVFAEATIKRQERNAERRAAYARNKNPGKYIDEALDEAASALLVPNPCTATLTHTIGDAVEADYKRAKEVLEKVLGHGDDRRG
jgi:hypothetical protein